MKKPYIHVTETNRRGTSGDDLKKNVRYLEFLFIFMVLMVTGAVLLFFFSSSSALLAEETPNQDLPSVLRVVFFDVHQGDGVLISTPSGKNILIDAGQGSGKYTSFDGGSGVIVPYLKENGITRLDQVIMTHPHSDHLGGLLSVLKDITVDEVLDPGMEYGSSLYKRFLLLIEGKGITWTEASDGLVLDWGDKVKAQILGPKKLFTGTRSDANNNSLVIKMIFDQVSFLFTGDIEAEAELEVLDYGDNIRSNVLKVPHHGGEFSSTDSFVRTVRPEFAVIMCGLNNKFGHPNEDTVSRYRNVGARVLRTDLCGTITMLSDGKRISLKTEKTCE